MQVSLSLPVWYAYLGTGQVTEHETTLDMQLAMTGKLEGGKGGIVHLRCGARLVHHLEGWHQAAIHRTSIKKRLAQTIGNN